MKRTILGFSALLTLLMLFSIAPVSAQGNASQQTFDVPFDFHAGGKTLPAGAYNVSNEGQTVKIRSTDGKRTVFVIPSRTRGASNIRNAVKLSFKRSGDQYFLSQIWLPDNIGRELKKHREPSTDVAGNSATVDIAGLTR